MTDRAMREAKAAPKSEMDVDFSEIFEYIDGDLIWKKRPISHFYDERAANIFNTRCSGKKAGSPMQGYLHIQIYGVKVQAHRIIFKMFHGFYPKAIDHIDGNPLNNRVENLRECTLAQNQFNSKRKSNNKSGIKGVCKNGDKWQANIRYNGKTKYLGIFNNIEDAMAARQEAASIFHGEFVNHG